MAENTHISWADDTFNPWVGCMKVSPACDGCYAEHMMDTRMGRVKFGGPGKGVGTRQRTTPAYWRKPLAWNREQEALEHNSRIIGEVAPARFVFCASLADVFDIAVPTEWRRDLFDLIRQTPHLTWLLLTKRPQNIAPLFSDTVEGNMSAATAFTRWPRNAAIGCTVVTQDEAQRDLPRLLRAKATLNPAFAFLSMEPLLEPVDVGPWLRDLCPNCHQPDCSPSLRSDGAEVFSVCGEFVMQTPRPALDWVITGGETDQGAHMARPAHPDWFRSLRDQCAAAGVPYHHKQHGEWAPICWMADGLSDSLYHPAPKRDPEAIRRCKVEHTVMNGDGSLHPGAADPETYRVQDRSMLMFKAGKKRSGRLIDGFAHDARPEVRS
jgi:protein gp37